MEDHKKYGLVFFTNDLGGGHDDKIDKMKKILRTNAHTCIHPCHEEKAFIHGFSVDWGKAIEK